MNGSDGEAVARAELHAACLRMVADGLVIGSSGNISVRVDDSHAVISAAGVPYGRLTADDHPVVDLADGSWTGPCRPTSELALHLGVLRALPDVGAVVHTHSRYAAAFAVARLDLPFICNENIATRAERVPVTEYAAPGSGDLGAAALAAFATQPGSRAVLLANHGVVAIGPGLDDAYLVAQSVEWTAEICHLARTLVAAGTGEHVLDHAVQDAIARNYGVTIARAADT
ncbi:MAG: class II aldolase/adducin family protein [Acidimicrobiia bacterium]|nr:class II aldolase/adducin family protein [Acidimicrobiia bacterium]